jgi:two-component system, OmpR family, sensor histidine kinase AdeS
MKRKVQFTLRTQMVLAVIVSICAMLIASFILGQIAEDRLLHNFHNSLSPAAKRVSDQVDAYVVPTDIQAVKEYLEGTRRFEQDVGTTSTLLVIGLLLVGILTGGIIATYLSVRIGRPLSAVTTAASRLADGDLTVRVDAVAWASGETESLIRNFNHMADALERYQRQSIESSAAIAHELRTPLAILRGRLQGMMEGVFETKPRDLDGLVQQVDSLTRIVSDLNIVSLAQAGRLSVHTEPVWLEEIAASLLHTMIPDLEKAGLVLESDLQPANALADPSRFRQALLALIHNVQLHAASGGQIRVETGVERRSAFVRILDRGPGFSVDSAPRIFEPFWRRETSRSRATGGTGLGLSVVASIAAALGGTVAAKAREGGGSVFEIRLPRS